MKAITRKPVVMEVANQIRAAILDGGLVPGRKIAQDELATELGVSRLPIRQALLVLQREGLVFLDHGRGAVVAPIDVKFISDLFDYRATVDGYVAAVLAARPAFDPSVLRRIVREGREAARRGESRRDLIMEFHTAQYRAVGNQVLGRIMEPLLDHVQRVVTFVQGSAVASGHERQRKSLAGKGQSGLRSQVETWAEHAEIVEAIAGRRVGRARALAKSHVDRVKQVVVAYLVSAAPSKHGKAGRHNRRALRDLSFDVHPELTVTFDAIRVK
jgi:DNA-binding GntR family transcriptional regulator